MFEKVNPGHPDKMADRIAGAIVDLCYKKSKNPKVACEVLIGHGECNIQVETSEQISAEDCEAIVRRIAGEGIVMRALIVPQDCYLAANQRQGVRCGDNGIFKGVPPTHEQKLLTDIAGMFYKRFPYDGKYVVGTKPEKRLDKDCIPYFEMTPTFTICQSHATELEIDEFWEDEISAYLLHDDNQHYDDPDYVDYWQGASTNFNPLGEWTGGPNTDSGATNRKLGSDMGDGVTGGGLHGKDLSKADVSVNIVCYLKAVASGQVVTANCSIGDEEVTFTYAIGKTETMSFRDVVEYARLYILTAFGGSFERFSEWGLIRPKD